MLLLLLSFFSSICFLFFCLSDVCALRYDRWLLSTEHWEHCVCSIPFGLFQCGTHCQLAERIIINGINKQNITKGQQRRLSSLCFCVCFMWLMKIDNISMAYNYNWLILSSGESWAQTTRPKRIKSELSRRVAGKCMWLSIFLALSPAFSSLIGLWSKWICIILRYLSIVMYVRTEIAIFVNGDRNHKRKSSHQTIVVTVMANTVSRIIWAYDWCSGDAPANSVQWPQNSRITSNPHEKYAIFAIIFLNWFPFSRFVRAGTTNWNWCD